MLREILFDADDLKQSLATLVKLGRPLREVEDLYILAVVADKGDNKSAAAKALDMDRRTLYRRLAAIEKKGAGQ